MSVDQPVRLRRLMMVIALLSATSSAHTAYADSEMSGSDSSESTVTASEDWQSAENSQDSGGQSANDAECGANVEQSRC